MKPKHQPPTSKHQRSSKPESKGATNRRNIIFKYPVTRESALALNDAVNGNIASKHPFDLEERTARFGEAIVRFSKKIPCDPTNDRLIDQLVGCGTSIGGNYCEANEGVSKKDFRNMISRCVKESKERSFSFGCSQPRNRSLPVKRVNIIAT
jgi:four helix bundle protein